MALIKLLAQAEAQPAIDKVMLHNVEVSPDKEEMRVHVAKGYEANGEFVIKSMAVHSISGADYNALMDSMGDPGMSVKEMLQEAIWAKLEAMGVLDVQ